MLEEKRNNGLKNDLAEDKLRWDLLPIEEIEELVDILTKGAKKYADNSWQELPNGVERYKAALMRHLVKNINSTVSENDLLFCLGDWSFGGQANISKYRNMINVKEIRLTPGNHDDKLVSLIKTDQLVRSSFVLCRDISMIKCYGCIFVLSHMPVRDDIIDKLLKGRNIDNTPHGIVTGKQIGRAHI